MEDKFKEFVTSNRDAFELTGFDMDQSWDAVVSGMKERKENKKKSKKAMWLSIAASVTLLVLLGSVLHFSQEVGSSNEDRIFASVPELAEAHMFYISQIDRKMAIAHSKIDDAAIFRDIEELDLAFTELKADLKDNVDNEEVVIAMIENYQLKLKILDRILEELKKDDNNQGSSKL